MMRRLVLALVLVLVSSAAHADCMSGLCGNWTSAENGKFSVGPAMLTWNNHMFKSCFIVAQDPRITIAKCNKMQNEGSDKIRDMVVFFYLRRSNSGTMQVIYADKLPEECLATAGCWPSRGMFFHKLKDISNNTDSLHTDNGNVGDKN